MHYCVLIAVTSADTRNALSSLLTSLRNYVIPRWYPGSDTSGPADYYVLGVGGAAVQQGTNRDGTPIEIQAGFILGYNQDCATNVQNLVANVTQYAEGSLCPNPPLDRATLAARLVQMAGERGCDHVWSVKPGDDVTAADNAALLAKFTPVG